MNRKILTLFYKMLLVSVLSVLVFWLGGSVLLFQKQEVDSGLPQYLILSVEEHIVWENDEAVLDDFLVDSMKKHNMWLQILNKEGNVVFEKNTDAEIPKQYEAFELVNVCMKSNRIHGYTVFGMPLSNPEGYGVLLGCDSNLVSKHSFIYKEKGKNDFVKSFILLLLSLLLVVVAASIIFMKKISVPVTDIIAGIEEVSVGSYRRKHSSTGIFQDVFHKLDSLDGRLRENKRSRNEWIANISHDIKTPLATIRGYAEILSNSDYQLERDEIYTYGREIQKAEETVESLVADLRLTEQLSEGKVKLQRQETDLGKILEECKEEMLSMSNAPLQIEIDIRENVVVFCDRKLVKRAFHNLIQNTFVHNEEGVVLCIALESMEDGNYIMFRDNGKGMKQEEVSRIFERYFRGTNSANTTGTGLGMAIVKEVIDIHKWKIKAESREGQGTTFTIWIER